VVRTDPHLEVADSLSQCLDEMYTDGPLDFLYGDTLFDQVAPTAASIVVGRTSDYYDWRVESGSSPAGDPEIVCAGLFCFSEGRRIHHLVRESARFIEAVERYSAEYAPLERREARIRYDFGHVHTYFTSKQAISTTRHFTSMTVDDGVMTKLSADARKMAAEAAWFENAPPPCAAISPNSSAASWMSAARPWAIRSSTCRWYR
jgi:hypothetical protein